MALFDRYLIADYSGAGGHGDPLKGIAVCLAAGKKGPVLLEPDGRRFFSRDSLRERIIREMDAASRRGERLLFGMDHSFSWPSGLWARAGLGDCGWREAMVKLAAGYGHLPPLDIPRRYCRAFNHAVGDVFHTPFRNKARLYGLPVSADMQPDSRLQYRLTERALFEAGFNPKPADTVGGQGAGMVGGQNICGMHQIARLLELGTVAWWPFDGPDVQGPAYAGRHVGIEVYPALFVPSFVKKSDENDALYTCHAIQAADRLNWLEVWMRIPLVLEPLLGQVMKEGWIPSVRPPVKEGLK